MKYYENAFEGQSIAYRFTFFVTLFLTKSCLKRVCMLSYHVLCVIYKHKYIFSLIFCVFSSIVIVILVHNFALVIAIVKDFTLQYDFQEFSTSYVLKNRIVFIVCYHRKNDDLVRYVGNIFLLYTQ